MSFLRRARKKLRERMLDRTKKSAYVNDGGAFTPEGQRFAREFRKGLVTRGQTTIEAFFAAPNRPESTLSESVLRILTASSKNEGNYEAINSWDNAFLSFGILQWTAGVGTGRGELAGLLRKIDALFPDAFAEHFASRRIGSQVGEVRPQSLVRGFLLLDGRPLDNPESKEVLRSPDMAHYFWRAGQDDRVREAQNSLAADRIGVFYDNSNFRVKDRQLSDYVTSEVAVALVFDQHVNRPGHVKRVMTEALDLAAEEGLRIEEPFDWGTPEETRLLELYLERRALTSMTHSQQRADVIFEQSRNGRCSPERGSFAR